MIDRSHGSLSVVRQCRLLGLARSSAYYVPSGSGNKDLEVMRRIDELYTECPLFRATNERGESVCFGRGEMFVFFGLERGVFH